MKSMDDLFLSFLQDIYHAEKQGLRAIPKMVKAAESQELKDALQQHREQSQHQIERLEQVFEQIGKRARGKTCEAMQGLIEEGAETIEQGEKGPVLDAALIACEQGIEHYEIARYGTMVVWAKLLGHNEAADLLQRSLDEEKEADRLLNELAERSLNQKAAESDAEDEESAQDDEGEAGGDEDGERQEEKPQPKPKAKRSTAKK